jgi:hypothetical protein
VGISFCSNLFFILRIPLEEIDDPTPIPQILWIFGRRRDDKRITLEENPHFYHDIPLRGSGSESEFDDWKGDKGFHRDPLTEIGSGNGTVYVILDKLPRLYLDAPEPHIFSNMWRPQKKIILKG